MTEFVHTDADSPRDATLWTVENVIGDTVIMPEGPIKGDVIVTRRRYPMRTQYPYDVGAGTEYKTVFTHYLVTGVYEPRGVCNGHCLIRLKKIVSEN